MLVVVAAWTVASDPRDAGPGVHHVRQHPGTVPAGARRYTQYRQSIQVCPLKEVDRSRQEHCAQPFATQSPGEG